MSDIRDGSVDLMVTSPPYWQIKDYGSKDQIGHGQTLHDYLKDLYRVFKEVYRVLSPGRRACINIGDQFTRASIYGRYKVVPIHAEIILQMEKIGFDFMALTDHGLYAPSIESQAAFEAVDTDLRIYRGEEVHPPDNPVHIVNFGGSASVNDLFSQSRYRSEVPDLERRLGDIGDARDRYCYASSLWCFD
ncbi:MAG: DNA methyltransferase, partial [Candidatus Fermentibacteria bacterium]